MLETSSKTKIVVGLGNPGDKYQGTRHNVGFEVLDHLVEKYPVSLRAKFEGQLATLPVAGGNLVLVWPLTFMNLSGRCVQAVVNFYKVDAEQDVLVVCDDLSLPTGKLRMRGKGSAGGQKGLNDILKALGSQAVPRLRIGIDSPPPRWETADYVLAKFRKDEMPVMDVAVAEAAQTALDWFTHGITYCMNRVN